MAINEYAFADIEKKWQDHWERHKTFRTPNPGEPGFDAKRPKFYVLDMFPYPSGAGLHVGHPEGYTATDIIARYKRMCGWNVLHPMGWDAFGLPAEQHAVETRTHPRATTEKNIATFRRQLKMLGFSYDWDRELSTTDVEYYRWTQWIFLQLFNSWYDEKAGKARPIKELPIPGDVKGRGEKAVREYVDSQRLAYLAEVPVNWCPALGTVLANEEVTNDGRSERGNHPVFRRPLRQWMLRITKYGDRLEKDLDLLAWPESVKIMQRNWIGRSEGAQVTFRVEQASQSRDREGAGTADSRKPLPYGRGSAQDDVVGINAETIEIYTTRPDTLFGATYMVLAPEHPLVETLTTPAQLGTVLAYREQAARRNDLDRTADAKTKTGVFTGAYAVNPVFEKGDSHARIPIWIADYVLMGYGTGAIMAVPGHDTRDFEFAKQFNLPIVAVVAPPKSWFADDIVRHLAPKFDVGRDTVEPDLLPLVKLLAEATRDHARVAEFVDRDYERLLLPGYVNDPGDFQEAYTGDGKAINSGPFDGQPTTVFKKSIVSWLEACGVGKRAVNYKLRDWLFSRQRYWGEPFPILHGPDGELVALDESELPLTLPEIDDYRPTSSGGGNDAVPEPPLGRAKDWVTVQRGGKAYRRELNTMPQWAGSCWYYLRFLDPKNSERFCSREAERYWMVSKKGAKPVPEAPPAKGGLGGCLDSESAARTRNTPPVPPFTGGEMHAGGIDLYLGGAEHAVLHLLYARFWHKVLYDLGHVSTPEPFGKLFNQGMIRAFAYTDKRGAYIGYDDIDFREDGAHHKQTGEKLVGAVEKMSKSMKNVINPEDVVHEYGADSLRLYEMFMGPLDASKPWNPRDVPGVFRFLQRIWRFMIVEETGDINWVHVSNIADDILFETTFTKIERLLHKTIKKVSDDIDRMAFNTAISAMMEFVNAVHRVGMMDLSQAERFVLLLSPFAPHIAEELWQRLKGSAWKGSAAYEPWPTYDAELVVDDTVEIPVQISGKLAGKVTVARDADQATVKAAAMADEKVAARIAGATVVKTIFVPGRLLNLVVKK